MNLHLLPISRAAVVSAMERRRVAFERLVRAHVVQPAHSGTPYAEPEAVTRYLQACHALVTQELARDAEAFSSAQWLWYLRRVPPYLMQSVQDAEVDSYVEANMADSITGLDLIRIGGQVSYVGRRSFALRNTVQ